jgi:hypothetical protein
VGFLLPKVWIRVYGLRRELCEFLDLWAVGSMLGSTQIVDMETTRKSDFGRVLVAVLNPGLILTQLDVVIGDHYFELEFEVERRGLMRTVKRWMLSGPWRWRSLMARVLLVGDDKQRWRG